MRNQSEVSARDVCERIVRQWEEDGCVWVGCVEDARAVLARDPASTLEAFLSKHRGLAEMLLMFGEEFVKVVEEERSIMNMRANPEDEGCEPQIDELGSALVGYDLEEIHAQLEAFGIILQDWPADALKRVLRRRVAELPPGSLKVVLKGSSK